jgi:hypothetical protein
MNFNSQVNCLLAFSFDLASPNNLQIKVNDKFVEAQAKFY